MWDMVAEWSAGFAVFTGRFAGRFTRVESRRQMAVYLRGLLSETERKNGWTLAEAAGDGGPQGMQRLLNFYAWDVDGVRDDVAAGVARQYSGTAGRVENSQVGVFAAYASPRGRGLIDRELYIPKDWFTDRQRCRTAGIPDEVEFATKPDLARGMIARALAAELPFKWVTADEAYGQIGRLRLWLEEHDLAHVLAVPKSQMVISMDLRQRRAAPVIAELAESDWERLSCGDGAHGQRLYDWAALDIRPWREPGRGHWLLARRSITDPDEIAYYICYGPADTELAELVRVAGARWAIEECFQTAKNETGLDHYQVRRYEAWYRHITLSMAAAAFLLITRNTLKKRRR